MSLARDLSIDFLKCAEGFNDELWMLCARCSGSISVIENVHQLVSVFLLLRRLFQLFYVATRKNRPLLKNNVKGLLTIIDSLAKM